MSHRYLYQCTVKGCSNVYDNSGNAVNHERATGHMAFKIVVSD